MNLKNKDADFIVYEHISPNGKRYVGITCKQPGERWLQGGKGYKTNSHFWSAICKYGWDNFQHNIVASKLSLDEACKLESDLIKKYDLMNPDKGYNHTSGGNWTYPDESTRVKISEGIKRSRAMDPDIQARITNSLRGHPVSAETRKKISKANSGRKCSDKEIERRRNYHPTPETIAKIKSHPSWNKGLTKETDPRVMRISKSMIGRKLTPEQLANLSASRKAQYANGYQPVWVNNGKIETAIQKGSQLPEGFTYGRLDKGAKYIYKGDESKKVPASEIQKFLDQGWSIGRPDSVRRNLAKAAQKMHWEYDGLRFDSAQLLAEYLNCNGYPNIVSSTITALAIKGFSKSPTYSALDGKIRKVIHEDKIYNTDQP